MRFYVYTLSDPRTGDVFYLGKGQKNRLYDHEIDARHGKSGLKCEAIREIWADGLHVRYEIVRRFDIEEDAYAAEKNLIAKIGIENLTNVYPGGIPRRSMSVSAKGPEGWTLEGVKKIASRLKRALGLIMTTGGIDLVLGGERTDITEIVLVTVRDIMHDIGRKEFYDLVGAKYGGN